MAAEIKPFKLTVSKEKSDWILNRVKTAHIIPDLEHPEGEEWSHGVPSKVIQDLVDFWKTDYDWQKVQDHINSTFQMYTVGIEEGGETIDLHFVHHRSEEEDAIPMLFAHGWPGNFLEAENMLSLTKADNSKQQAFHVVVPSIPGFTFSSPPKKPGFTVAKIAAVYNKLMLRLGYKHYVAQGGDWGSFILRAVAIYHPESCLAVHLNYVLATPPSALQHPLTILWLILRWFTPDQKKRLGRMQWWMKDESGYSKIQATKPQTISFALLDSPIGMLAWIREKIDNLVEPGYVWPKETVITWTMLYLLSENAGNARLYKEGIATLPKEVLSKVIPETVLFGASCFPNDIGYIPQWWAQVGVAKNIVFWREHEAGGHFPAVECGDVLKADFREFVEKVQGTKRADLLAAGK
ncbi:epoxide hydrolase domain-containing protein [Pluteus cervinus]|uniref:Epoxide hydrolase domain-containing protein n=1 Tax=Pluteus cervinus TaxID=181527 RepID=A0ACD3BA99_9AGAR|nr:epoxide hydrolase domain-containing protein [Pluteus cervinus]